MLEWVTIQKAADMSGYTVSALRNKINRLELLEGKHWKKRSDGRIIFHVPTFDAWIKQ